MNPFALFMNPFGMGCSCNFSMSMPYSDILSFLNFPIYRDTRYDYLLDPNLALQRCQQQWAQGGSIWGGSTSLPGFTFPAIGGFNNPAFPTFGGGWQPRTKTEEERKSEEKKKEEAEKPEAKKAQKLNDTFKEIKKLAEDKNNRFPVISEDVSKKAEEAMKKETAAEQYEAMKEVMSLIPQETIRKTILADNDIRKDLQKAGYNFNLEKNKYSLKNNDIKEDNITHSNKLREVHDDIQQRTYLGLQILASKFADDNSARDNILGVISSWNDKYHDSNDKGLLRWIGENLPEGDDAIAKSNTVKDNLRVITNALLLKADEYEGCEKIKTARDDVSKKLEVILKTDGFTKENINKLADSFDVLYARLRMQEAIRVRDAIKANPKYKDINEVKEGILNDDMIVTETRKDLEAEGLTAPSISDLDAEPVREEIRIAQQVEAEDADEKYKDNPQELVDEYLVKEKGILTKVSDDSKVYQTASFNNSGNGTRYFSVSDDNKLVEVFKNNEGKFVQKEGAEEVNAKDLIAYNISLNKARDLINKNIVTYYEGNYTTTKHPYPIFKATGADEYYAIFNNEFCKIDNCTGLKEDKKNKKIHVKGTNKTLDSLTENDFTIVENDDDITSKAKAEKLKKDKEEADIKKVQNATFASVTDIDNENLEKLGKDATGRDDDFEPLDINGYFYCKSKKRYYRYNEKTGKLDYLRGVTKISNTGYMIKDGKWLPCKEVIESEEDEPIQEYAKTFAKDLNGITNDKEYIDAKRRLNTFTSFTDAEDIINFVKGYKAYGGFWSNSGMCKQIASENGLKIGKSNTDKETKWYYIKWIAIRFKTVFNKTNLKKNSDEYKMLDYIANGNLYKNDIILTAENLDMIIDVIIKAYDEKQNKKNNEKEDEE